MENVEKEFISERQASKLLEVDPATVKNWREKGFFDGMYKEKQYPEIKRVFYDKAKLLEWQKSFKR